VRGDANQQKGEIVLMVAGRGKVEQEVSADVSSLLVQLSQYLPAKQAAEIVADFAGLRKKQLYEHLLTIKKERGE